MRSRPLGFHCIRIFRALKSAMDTPTAIGQMRQACKNIGLELMRMHPAVPPLAEKTAQDEIYKALFEITKQVEVIKKQIGRLEAGATTPEL